MSAASPPKRVLVLGGTRFIGPFVVRQLAAHGHAVTIFHRGQTEADLPVAVRHLHGRRRDLATYRRRFAELGLDVVVDLNAYTAADAAVLQGAVAGVAPRLVVISSQDIYRAYARLRGTEPGPPDALPLAEDGPLREQRYPYRAYAAGEGDLMYHYEKLDVEEAVQTEPAWRATILRLPCVYGPGDPQRRFYPYLKPMVDGRPVVVLAEGQASWRWTRGYVENVAAAIVHVVEDDRAAGAVYNVGEARPRTEAAWVEALAETVGWEGRVVTIPQEAMPRGNDAMDWRQELVVDASRLREELGFEPPVAFEEGLRRTVNWEQDQPPPLPDPVPETYAAEEAAWRRWMRTA